MNYVELVKQREHEIRKKNIEEAVNLIGTKELNEKIDNFTERVHFPSREKIENKIKNDKPFAVFFAKDPKKQSVSEKAFCEYLDVKTLPQSGKNTIRFSSFGEKISTKEKDCSKSADFKIGSYYITQKYTGENTGGAQDNQYDLNDLEKTQHYTINASYILQGLIDYIPKYAKVIGPFVGNDDLLGCFPNWDSVYDIEPSSKVPETTKRDTLTFPPDYHDKWIITNPPFLAKK